MGRRPRRGRPVDDPDHGSRRTVLRVLGFLFVGAGVILVISGVSDFFGAFHGEGMPTRFWHCFVGVPLLGIGTMMLQFGFMGTVTRYASREIAPGVGHLAEAVGRGLREGRNDDLEPEAIVRCHKCDQDNDADASFCSGCGTALRKTKPCPSCGEVNDPDVRFCDECGQAYG